MASQPDHPGPPDRPGHDRGRQRRPLAEDHRRRARRDPRAEEHDQHDGRPALVLRRRGHARRARGRHRGRPRRPGRGQGRVSGTWRDLTESVNGMASNLTDQVRQIANVTTAVADGDLTQKVTVEARGEVAALADTINSMTEHAAHVRRPGDRRGARGGHRGRARRPGRRAGRRGHLEGPHRLGELDGDEPDRPGAPDRRRHDRGRQRRPDAEGHRRDQGRGGGARRHDQLDDRDAAHVRRRR